MTGQEASIPQLTRRERDVLGALCEPALQADVFTEPASVRQIAKTLVVTEAAVKQHLLHLYDKFGITERDPRRRVRLAKEAIRRGAVALPDVEAVRRPTAGTGELLRAGRQAFARRDWEGAFARLFEADSKESLGTEDLERLGEACHWTNRHEKAWSFRQRAYQAHLQAGNRARGGYMALLLAIHYGSRLDFAVAGGWFAKAQRLLESEPECEAHGHLAVVAAMFKEAVGDWVGVLDTAKQAYEIGRRCGDPDLQALGLAFQGLALTHQGQIADGTQLLDEAMVSAVAGELTPLSTGFVYCRMLCACLDLQDFGRAGEWTEVIDRCAAKPGLGGLPGDCRTHRAEVLLKRGTWAEGAQEAVRAVEEAATFHLLHAGIASRELGEIRLRMGDLQGAEEACLRAHEYGTCPEPVLSLIRLARGEPASAAAGLETWLAALGDQRLVRARLLPAKVEVALAADNLDSAGAAVAELEETAAIFGTVALRAVAAQARGALELAVGNVDAAASLLTLAHGLWQQMEAPYEAARLRSLLAAVNLARGDRESCLLELRAARTVFERLGANLDVERSKYRMAELIDTSPLEGAPGRAAVAPREARAEPPRGQ